MMLSGANIASLLDQEDVADPFVIAPKPDTNQLKKSGEAAVDLRLGTWFLTLRRSAHAVLQMNRSPTRTDESAPAHARAFSDMRYVPFGGTFVLHPRSFVLAITMEWIRMTCRHGGYVMGKSSWGRRGLVIETAPGVHPGFSGCLTLELANVGEIPIELTPGARICQLFVHVLEGGGADSSVEGRFTGRRQPILGQIAADPFLEKLSKK
jgi:dCTP deaminase